MDEKYSEPEFGITVSCYSGDVDLLRGCIESIRCALPAIRICLIPHGDLDLASLVKQYNLLVLNDQSVDARIRHLTYGYGLTKMIAFWHSPFKKFMHIDADAVLWGNPIDSLDLDCANFIYNNVHEKNTDQIIESQYYNRSLLPVKWHLDEWRSLPYFNTGIFIADKNCFDIEDYIELLKIQNTVPGSIFTDQGILNILLFKYISENRLSGIGYDLQTIVPVTSFEKLDSRFAFESNIPTITHDQGTLIHWAGPKPRAFSSQKFRRPMDYFRLKSRGLSRPPFIWYGMIVLFIESFRVRVLGLKGEKIFGALRFRIAGILNAREQR